MNGADRSFQLRVFPVGDGDYGVELTQETNGQLSQRIVRSWGASIHAVGNHLLEAIKASGYRPTDLNRNRRKPFAVPEVIGVRLGLALLAVNLSKNPAALRKSQRQCESYATTRRITGTPNAPIPTPVGGREKRFATS